ncbi:MAG: hypothetical protein RR576_11150, partial [Oscillospiraceae bacterium]
KEFCQGWRYHSNGRATCDLIHRQLSGRRKASRLEKGMGADTQMYSCLSPSEINRKIHTVTIGDGAFCSAPYI